MTQPNRYFVRDTADQVHDLVAAYRQAAAEARTRVMTDDSIYGDAKTGATAAAIAALRELYGARLDAVATKAQSQLVTLQNAAARMLPKPATGVEALLTRQTWWQRIQTMTSNGVRVIDVIRNADDPECLFALRDELSTAIAAGLEGFGGRVEDTQATITARLAQLAGQDAVDAQEAAQDAQQAIAALQPSLDAAAHEIGATNHRHTSAADFGDQLAQYGLRPRSSY